MELCQKNFNFSFQLRGSCRNCLLKREKSRVLTLDDIIPPGLCPFAYYSFIPYWAALIQGAWFSWEKDKDEVVCQCPKPRGVVFAIKRITQNKKISIEAEVIDAGKSSCPYQYSLGKTFKIGYQSFCPALFPSFWSQIDKLMSISKKIKIDYCLKPISLQIDKIKNCPPS